MPHAAIIGAGPAGCVAASLLARGGWRATLVEQHRFPRDKVCGECLSALGIDVVERIGLRRALDALQPAHFDRTILHAPRGARAELRLPRPMLGISRAALDGLLLNHARRTGAEVLQPARCEQIDGRRLRVRELVTNACRDLEVDWVLLADGKAALLPRRPAPTGDLGIKAHFENVDGPRSAIELFGVNGCYGGLAAIEQDRWNAAFAVPRARVLACGGDIVTLFEQIARENVTLAARVRGARRTSDWLAAPLPRFAVARDWPEHVIPLGNAAAALEPIGGEGIGLAMRSAEMAAETLVAAQRKNELPDLVRLRRQFNRLWRARRAACRAAALAVSSGRLMNWALPLLEDSEGDLLRPMLRPMGKFA